MDINIIHATEIGALKAEVATLKSEVASMNAKLDHLLAFKNKGAGAFWLAAALFGTGIAALIEYLKGLIT